MYHLYFIHHPPSIPPIVWPARNMEFQKVQVGARVCCSPTNSLNSWMLSLSLSCTWLSLTFSSRPSSQHRSTNWGSRLIRSIDWMGLFPPLSSDRSLSHLFRVVPQCHDAPNAGLGAGAGLEVRAPMAFRVARVQEGGLSGVKHSLEEWVPPTPPHLVGLLICKFVSLGRGKHGPRPRSLFTCQIVHLQHIPVDHLCKETQKLIRFGTLLTLLSRFRAYLLYLRISRFNVWST